MVELPSEILNTIFDLAADEHVIFDPSLPNSMAESTWFTPLPDQWQLRTPQDSVNLIQRRSYATKKAIISTCKQWRRLGSEFLVRCLFFDHPGKLQSLWELLNGSDLGWWTRRIHIARFYKHRDFSLDEIVKTIVAIIQMCPNLEIFIVDWPMSSAFGPIVDALCKSCVKSLRSVYWHVPAETLPKVIWALDRLPALCAVHIEFDAPKSETLHLGAAANLDLKLPNLEQLSVTGSCQDFLEQAADWHLPALHSLSFDFGMHMNDIPDLETFLTHHGAALTFLDLHCMPTLDIAALLGLCPLLTSFAFNADWVLPSMDEDSTSDEVKIVNVPHQNIAQIGLHGLMEAFGVGFGTDELRVHLFQRMNEKNIGALTRANFPALKKVRALSRPLLRALDDNDGPHPSCMPRWDKWWAQFSGMGVRLEDCTGALLGTLPELVDESSFEDEEEYTDSEDEEEEVEDLLDENGGPARLKPETLSELRQLLEECWKMSEEREEPVFPPFAVQY
ncbi:hypothetical protein HWV62_21420 [Athelia sp. TMB]|nr:hypothetical protein HWV62_21420 [Athelia sp. TMB]